MAGAITAASLAPGAGAAPAAGHGTDPMMRTVAAAPASSLLGMEGVNTHSSYGTTPYANQARTITLLQELGVEHVRDPLAYNRRFVRFDQYDFFNALKARGIGVDLILSPDADTSEIAARLATVARYFPTAVDAIEAPNELNHAAGVADWAGEDDSYQQILYDDLLKVPALSHADVLGPSLALRRGYSSLGYLAPWLDAGNIHLYPGGSVPTLDMDATLANERMVSGDKPEWVTEAGYHDAVLTPGRDAPASDAAIADYLPRMILDYYQRGAARVNLYELYDEHPDGRLGNYEDHFGLVANDGTPKPQFYAVANLNRLLAGTTGGTSFVPRSLSYSLSSAATPVSSVVVEKSNGHMLLLVWQEAEVWDRQTLQPVPVTPTPVTVTLASAARSITEYRPSLSGRAVAAVAGASTVTVPLAGDVVALDITP